jgi:hypothetical protein
MSFRIYDRSFKLLESINHLERAIIGCEYDTSKDMLILSGALGMTIEMTNFNNLLLI